MMNNLTFLMEGTVSIVDELFDEQKIKVGINMPNVYDLGLAHDIDLTTEPIKFEFQNLQPNLVTINGVGVGGLEASYVKSSNGCNCNNNDKKITGDYSKIVKCNCITPGTLRLNYRQLLTSEVSPFSLPFPSYINLLMDFTKDEIKIHWRKEVSFSQTKFLLGSTDESVIILKRSSKNTTFKFVVVCMDYLVIPNAPLYIGVTESVDNSDPFKSIYSIDNMKEIEDSVVNHNKGIWTHFNIGKYAMTKIYTKSDVDFFEITSSGDINKIKEDKKEGDDTNGEGKS